MVKNHFFFAQAYFANLSLFISGLQKSVAFRPLPSSKIKLNVIDRSVKNRFLTYLKTTQSIRRFGRRMDMSSDVWDSKSCSRWWRDSGELEKSLWNLRNVCFSDAFMILTTTFDFDDDYARPDGEKFDRFGEPRSFRIFENKKLNYIGVLFLKIYVGVML